MRPPGPGAPGPSALPVCQVGPGAPGLEGGRAHPRVGGSGDCRELHGGACKVRGSPPTPTPRAQGRAPAAGTPGRGALTGCTPRTRRAPRPRPGRRPPPPAGTRCSGPRAPTPRRASPACAGAAAGPWAAAGGGRVPATWRARPPSAAAAASGGATCTSLHPRPQRGGSPGSSCPTPRPSAPPLRPAWRAQPISAPRAEPPASSSCASRGGGTSGRAEPGSAVLARDVWRFRCAAGARGRSPAAEQRRRGTSSYQSVWGFVLRGLPLTYITESSAELLCQLHSCDQEPEGAARCQIASYSAASRSRQMSTKERIVTTKTQCERRALDSVVGRNPMDQACRSFGLAARDPSEASSTGLMQSLLNNLPSKTGPYHLQLSHMSVTRNRG
ncbi:unnamed protein product [Nyctereutes procyonoides]|uniref:(raccoon dog) hypothetical protein n=1 Tax=Nyctereutes procyonoides TaxID=34880 RepID=A0A811ZM19_NYCPR|nr:unnamed protein product [Nyctereutes procyonoides]